jgi:hypothetical protein
MRTMISATSGSLSMRDFSRSWHAMSVGCPRGRWRRTHVLLSLGEPIAMSWYWAHDGLQYHCFELFVLVGYSSEGRNRGHNSIVGVKEMLQLKKCQNEVRASSGTARTIILLFQLGLLGVHSNLLEKNRSQVSVSSSENGSGATSRNSYGSTRMYVPSRSRSGSSSRSIHEILETAQREAV